MLGFKCYKCVSWSFWKDCEKKCIEYICFDVYNERCYKVIYYYKLYMRKMFIKFCVKEDECIEGNYLICFVVMI